MQNIKEKLVNKINTTLVPSANSLQSSQLNPFNYFNTPSASSNTSTSSSTNTSNSRIKYLDDSDDKLIQLVEEDENYNNHNLNNSLELVLSNREAANEEEEEGEFLLSKKTYNNDSSNRIRNDTSSQNTFSVKSNSRATHSSSSSNQNNSFLVDIGLVSDLDPTNDSFHRNTNGNNKLKSFLAKPPKLNIFSNAALNKKLDAYKIRKSSNPDSSSDDIPMLNPNYSPSDEEAAAAHNNENSTSQNQLANPNSDALMNQSTASDHCHVLKHNEEIEKRKHTIVWRKLIIVLCLCTLFMIGEIVGGLLANSISIQTDAAHMAADIAGFFFSIMAIFISTKEPTRRMSFGYHRSEILGALFSTLVIWVLTGVLVYMAVLRCITLDFKIEPIAMVTTASCGVVFNIIMYVVLHTNICFRGINLGHHGHSHSGAGHGHGHSHGGSGRAKTTAAAAPSAHGHSHSAAGENGGGHGHSHEGDHGHSHGGAGSHGHSHDTTVRVSKTNLNGNSNDYSIPINDNFTLSSTVNDEDCGENHRNQLVQDDEHHDEVDVNDSNNINLRAAAIHVIGDFVQSVGVLIAAIIIYINPDYKLADPICTFIFSVLVILTTAPIIKDIYYVLMEAHPLNIKYEDVVKDLCEIPKVVQAHNLHIWCLTMEKIAMSVHLVTENNTNTQEVLKNANNLLRTKYKIEKTTIQVEYFMEGMSYCKQCKLPEK